MSDILERLAAHRLVPVVVLDDAAHADALAQALVDGQAGDLGHEEAPVATVRW